MSRSLHESMVRDRYTEAASKKVEALCCPVDYNREYLKVIPTEVIERDYGCGDPSKYLRSGETVLDLGSGTGKICFIAAQVVDYDALIEAGSETAAKSAGKLRTEGKDYVMQPGDVVEFRFNVSK